MSERAPIDRAALRARLADRRGAAYWRSLEELAQTPAFLDFLKSEFPPLAALGARLYASGLRLFRSQHPCRQGRRLH